MNSRKQDLDLVLLNSKFLVSEMWIQAGSYYLFHVLTVNLLMELLYASSFDCFLQSYLSLDQEMRLPISLVCFDLMCKISDAITLPPQSAMVVLQTQVFELLRIRDFKVDKI